MENRQTGQQSITRNPEKTGGRRWFNGVLAADLVVGIVVVLILAAYAAGLASLHLSHGFGLGLDDGWIHLTFARNLARHHTWSLHADGLTGGTTSILWVLLLAGGFFITDNGPLIACVWNGVFLLGLGRLVRRFWIDLNANEHAEQARGHNTALPCMQPSKITDIERFGGIIPTLLTLACGNLVWYAFTGMETLLVLMLGLAAIHFAVRRRDNLTAFFVFLSALVRPEGFLVAAVVLLGRRNRAGVLKVIFAAGLGVLLTALWNYHLTGTVLPSTLAGRRWIIGTDASAALNPIDLLRNAGWLVGVWGYRLAEFTFGQKLFSSLGLPVFASWGLAVAGLLTAGAGLIAFLRKIRRPAAGMLLAWAILQLLAYAVMLPTRGHGGRYQPMILLLVMIFFVMGLGPLWKLAGKIKVLRLVPISLALTTVLSLFTWFRVLAGSLENFDRVHIPAAKWIDRHTAPQARVAGFDIGTLAYFGHRKIVDMGGLIDPEAGIALYDKTMPEYLKSKRADYLAMVFPVTDPEVYFNELELVGLEERGVLQWRETFSNDIPDPESYWPGRAARVLATKIRIYEISWATNAN